MSYVASLSLLSSKIADTIVCAKFCFVASDAIFRTQLKYTLHMIHVQNDERRDELAVDDRA